MELSYNELFFGKIEDDVYKGELCRGRVMSEKEYEEDQQHSMIILIQYMNLF